MPLTEATDTGLVIFRFALIPEGGFTSTRTLPVWRFTFIFYILSEAINSEMPIRVKGRTVIRELPARINAVLLKHVEITVSPDIVWPLCAGIQFSVSACFISTVPAMSWIIISWEKTFIAEKRKRIIRNFSTPLATQLPARRKGAEGGLRDFVFCLIRVIYCSFAIFML